MTMSFNRIILSYYDQGRIKNLAGEVGIEPTMSFDDGLTVRCITSLRIRQNSCGFLFDGYPHRARN